MAPSVPLLNPSGYYDRDDRPSIVFGAGMVFVVAVANAILALGVFVLVLQRIEAAPGARGSSPGSG